MSAVQDRPEQAVHLPEPGAWFAELFEANQQDLHRYALRRVGPDAADDVVAEVFLTAWRRRSDVPVDAPRLWLFGVAARVVANQRRSALRAERLTDRLAREPVDAPSADSLVDRVPEADSALRALAALSPADQELLRLTEWEQLSPADAAQVLGCATGAVRVRLHRARRRFAARLSDITNTELRDTELRDTEGHQERTR